MGWKSLRLRIAAVIVVLTLILGLGGTMRARMDLTRIGQTELEKRGVAVARSLAFQHADQILVNDIYTLYTLVNDLLLNNSDLRYIVILDAHGRVIVSSFPQGLPPGLREANIPAPEQLYQVRRLRTTEGIIYDIATPVVQGRGGVVRVGMLEGPLWAQVNRQTIELLALTGAITLVGAAAGFALGTLLTRPLSELVKVTQAIARGDLRQKAMVSGGDEVAKLARAFNHMTEALAQSRDQLLRLYHELQEKEALRGQLLQKLISAQEEERRRIARELHDQYAQALMALSISVETAERVLPPEMTAVRAQLEEVKRLAAQTLDQTYDLIFDLRPTTLDDLGLVPAIRWYAESRLEPLGIQFSLETTGLRDRLPAEVETALYRVIQEALLNVARHAHAQHVWVRLEVQDGRLRGLVRDDGQGFNLAELHRAGGDGRGVGLLGMKERIELLGGTLHIETAPGQGTCIVLEIPITLSNEEADGHI